MNSFKKIAIVVAAALTFTGISTVAQAAPLVVTVASAANATTTANPVTVAVPSTNVIDAGRTIAIAATADNGTVVSFAASSTVKLVSALNTSDAPKTVASGVSALSVTSAGTAVTVYAYTTSTTVGSVTVTNGAYSTIIYIKGTAGPAYNLAVTVPTAAAVGTVPAISVTTTDVFGNASSDTVTATIVGSTFADGSSVKSVTPDVASYSLATGVAGEVTVIVTGLTLVTPVSGFPAPVKAAIAKFAVSDLAAVINALKVELAVAQAELAKAKSDASLAAAKSASDAALAKAAADKALADAKAVSDATALSAKVAADLATAQAAAKYKAEYNALATKWNKKFPKLKVALKK